MTRNAVLGFFSSPTMGRPNMNANPTTSKARHHQTEVLVWCDDQTEWLGVS